jgi:hypothetical protein
MLGHRWPAHRQLAREIADRTRPTAKMLEYFATGRICQCSKSEGVSHDVTIAVDFGP